MDDHENLIPAGLVQATETRRDLLRTAVGGFVLAAGGLFLPQRHSGVSARVGAGDGAFGGRHGKDRRGQSKHKRRENDRKQDRKSEGPPPGRGAFEFRKTAVGVYADNSFTLTFFYRQKTGLDDYGPWILARSESGNEVSAARYAPDRYRIGVLVSAAEKGPGQFFVDLRNMSFGFPQGAVHVGNGLDPVRGNLGQVLVKERSFADLGPGSDAASVSRFYSIREDLSASFSLWRGSDSEDFIEFTLQITG